MAGHTLFGTKPGADGKVIFMGLPFAFGSEASNGGQHAPATIRTLSSAYNVMNYKFIDVKKNEEFFAPDDCSDLGDLQFRVQHGVEKYLNTLSDITSSIVKNGKSFLYLGGDHLASLGTIQGISKEVERFQVIHIDAHRDYRFVPDGDLPSHANFMYFVEQLPQVQKVIHLGLRGFDAVKYSNNKRISMEDVDDELSIFRKELLLDCPAFVTIDTDAFDPVIMPAVNFPVPFGLNPNSLEKVFDILRQEKIQILGCDWMEYNPDFDSKNKITGHQILHYLAKIIKFLNPECSNEY